MGRKSSRNSNLPPGMRARHRKSATYYYLDTGGTPRREIPLGTDYVIAIQKWGELTISAKASHIHLITFRYVAEQYLNNVVPTKAPGTQKNNIKELTKLYAFFDNPPASINNIEPIHIRQYLDWRVKETLNRLRNQGKPVTGKEGQVCANREKALFSHIWNFVREKGLTSKPNPCAGIRGFKEIWRDVYIDDLTYQAVMTMADEPTCHAMTLAYLTGQRPADVLKLSRTDIQDGMLCIQQNKTKKRLRILIEGELEKLIHKLTQPLELPMGKIQALTLIRSENGRALTAAALRFRFEKARACALREVQEKGLTVLAESIRNFQFRDLRTKAGTDKEETFGMAAAKDQLGHTNESMTQKYVRHRKGKIVSPTR